MVNILAVISLTVNFYFFVILCSKIFKIIFTLVQNAKTSIIITTIISFHFQLY